MPQVIKTIKKTYKDYSKYIEYDIAWFPSKGTKRKPKKTDESKKMERSVIRARTAILDIIACNEFDYFVTLTISPLSRIDRYDYDECSRYISKWLQNHLSHYILVPEKHKDGAFHFHLLADIPVRKLQKYNRAPRGLGKYGGRLYKIKSYKYGFSNAVLIEKGTQSNLAYYVSKYITKDLSSTVGKGRRMYWCSKTLKRPDIKYNTPIPVDRITVYENQHLKVHLSTQ